MATYAIGDIQGCHDELRSLLKLLKFNPKKDCLWFVGDLVNRGPKSLKTLRFVKSLGDSAITVLGNHDLHLLALAAGVRRSKRMRDTSLYPILKASDADELIHWLRHRPLLHRDKKLDFTMIHAGLPPQWKLSEAESYAREVETALRSGRYKNFLKQMYGNKPDRWKPSLKGMPRLRFITNSLTRLRYCTMDGTLALDKKGPPNSQVKRYLPWFKHPERKSKNKRILFGHWSTLGYRASDNVWGLDTGCLWGGQLTALRIDLPKPVPIYLPCKKQQEPKLFK